MGEPGQRSPGPWQGTTVQARRHHLAWQLGEVLTCAFVLASCRVLTFSPPPFLSLGSAAPSPPLSCYPFRASCGHSELFSCPGLRRAWPGKPVISTSGDRALLSHSADKCPREAIELPASGQREGPLMAPPSGTDRTSEGACRPGRHGGQSFAVSAGPATSTQPRPLATVKRGDPRRPDA